MPVRIDPEPPESEREAIVAALVTPAEQDSEWAVAALLEGVDADESVP